MELRDRLVSAPVPALPIDDGRFILDVDASDISVGAVLSQLQGGNERVIAYFSQRHAATEMNYCTTRKLAVVKALRNVRVYLLGRPFLLRTDHSALRWLRLTPAPFDQQGRWMVEIVEFDFEIEHRAGKKTLQS